MIHHSLTRSSFFSWQKISTYALLLFEQSGKLLVGLILVGGIILFSSASANFWLGNIFFGDIPSFYNIKIAHFLYQRAAYPSFGRPAVPYAHYQLSRSFFIQGELYNALDEAQAELQAYPEHTSTYYVLGLTYGYLNRSYEAIDAFSQYIETHPDTWAGRNDKAWLQFRLGNMDGALATIEPIAQNFKRTPWVQNTYCALLINHNRLVEAENSCNNAREVIDGMTEKDWGYAYPGNDPAIYKAGLEAMKQSIHQNLELIAIKKTQDL